MKKTALFCGVLLLSLLLCSCSGSVEVNDRTFVQVLGIDRIDNDYNVYIKVFDSINSEDDNKSLTGKGKNIITAISDAEESQDRQVFLGHTKIIVLGKGITEPQKELSLFLDGSISPSCLVTYSNMPERIADSEIDEYYNSEYLLNKMDNKNSEGKMIYSTLADIISSKQSYSLPVITTGYKELEFTGLRAVNSKNHLINLTDEQVMGVKILKDDFCHKEMMNISVTTPYGNAGIVVKSVNTKLEPVLSGDVIILKAKTNIKYQIKENPYNIADKDIKLSVKNYITSVCENSFATCINYGSCDIIGLRKLVLKSIPNSIGYYDMNLANSQLILTVDAEQI